MFIRATRKLFSKNYLEKCKLLWYLYINANDRIFRNKKQKSNYQAAIYIITNWWVRVNTFLTDTKLRTFKNSFQKHIRRIKISFGILYEIIRLYSRFFHVESKYMWFTKLLKAFKCIYLMVKPKYLCKRLSH